MKRVLFITHITGFLKPGNGGQLRTHHLLKELGKNNVVDVYCDSLCPSVIDSVAWRTLNLSKSVAPFKVRFLQKISRIKGGSRLKSCLDYFFGRQKQALFLELPPSLFNVWLNDFVEKTEKYQVIILDTLQQYPSRPWSKNGRVVWLNAHNVDSILNPKDTSIRALEENISRLVDGVICCTKNDELRFQLMNERPLKTVCWPNGTALPTTTPSDTIFTPSKVLFVGSLDYEPNLEGIRWFIKEVHPHLLASNEDYQLTVAGRNPSQTFLRELQSADRTSVLPNVVDLAALYQSHCISIVPLLSGSGSRLKIPESLIHGCPVISTGIGAEGYDSFNIPGLTISDTPQDFTKAIIHSFNHASVNRCLIGKFAEEHFEWSRVIQLCEIDLT
jgi:glycosyltransferase involved in cell wall biosynthesis